MINLIRWKKVSESAELAKISVIFEYNGNLENTIYTLDKKLLSKPDTGVIIAKVCESRVLEREKQFEKMKRGTQILYVPYHTDGDIDHPDCGEPGFVTSTIKPNLVWCRFWNKDLKTLRTKSCSERCFAYQLVIKDSVPQIRVDKTINEIVVDYVVGIKNEI
jgi:hypothetical protein